MKDSGVCIVKSAGTSIAQGAGLRSEYCTECMGRYCTGCMAQDGILHREWVKHQYRALPTTLQYRSCPHNLPVQSSPLNPPTRKFRNQYRALPSSLPLQSSFHNSPSFHSSLGREVQLLYLQQVTAAGTGQCQRWHYKILLPSDQKKRALPTGVTLQLLMSVRCREK